jgi:hypothetical protein
VSKIKENRRISKGKTAKASAAAWRENISLLMKAYL